MDYGALSAHFHREGFLVVEDFFDAGVMDGLDALIRRQFGVNPDFWHTQEFLTRAQTEVIPWFPQKEGVREFDGIESDARFDALTQAVLGDAWRKLYCMVMFSKQGTAGQAWHQDCSPDDASRHNLNRLVYTSDITEELGGQTMVVPGSHRRGILPAGDAQEPFASAVTLSPKRGTLVLLHGHTWHKVLPVKGLCRFSTNYRAMPAGTPDDITDVCVYRNMRYRFSTSSVVEERAPPQ